MPILKIIKIIKTYENWSLFFLDRAGLLKKLKGRETIFKLRNGIILKARLGRRGDSSIINEMWIVKPYFRHFGDINDNSTVIDIGAHIGTFSIFAAKQAKNVLVYSYEPCPENFSLLKENINLNHLGKNIKPFNLGVWERAGDNKLFLDDNYMQLATMCNSKKGGEKRTISIKCTTLKNIFEDNRINKCHFLKIDCEGSEYEILMNATPECLGKIETVSAELHFKNKNEGLKNYLEKNNFKVIIDEIDKGYILYAKNKSKT